MNNKILIVYSSPSHPTINGSRSIVLDYASYLSECGNVVYFMCVCSSIENKELELMKSYWQDRLIVYNPPFYKLKKQIIKYYRKWILNVKTNNVDDWYPIGLSRRVKHIIIKHDIDILWVNYIWFSKVFDFIKNVKKVLYVHDVFTDRLEKTGVNWFSTTKLQEKKAIDRADYIAVLQDEEALFLKSLTQKPVISVYGRFNQQPTKIVKNKNLLFLGSLNNHNVDAITWFIDNVYPILKQQDNEICLYVGGGVCNALNHYNDEINIFGSVNNIDNFYQLGNIVINPVFHGTGLKIKTFEALSHGKLLITNSHNVIGVPFPEIIPVFIAENKHDYCSLILKYISDFEMLDNYKIKSSKYISMLNDLFEKRFDIILNS